MIRLMHCYVTHEEMRVLYIRSLDLLTGKELDGRHNPLTRKKDFFEEVAKKYNDPDYNPRSHKFPDIHQEFQKEIDISYDAVKEMQH